MVPKAKLPVWKPVRQRQIGVKNAAVPVRKVARRVPVVTPHVLQVKPLKAVQPASVRGRVTDGGLKKAVAQREKERLKKAQPVWPV